MILWPFFVPPGSMWHCSLMHKHWLMIWPLCVPSASMWCCSLKHKCWLMILASLCATRLYVVLFFEVQVLAHDFGLFGGIRMYVVLFFEVQVLVHDFGLFVCHQKVCGVVL